MTSLLETLDGTIEVGFPFKKLREYKRSEALLSVTFEQVERAKQEWEFTVDSLPELVCLLDHNARIVRANRTVESWALGAVTAIKGRSVHDLLHPDCADPTCYLPTFLQRTRQRTHEGLAAELDIFDPHLDRHLLIRMRPATEKRKATLPSTVLIIHDVSERKRMERSLQRYTERLETMNEIGQAILEAHSPEEITQAAVSRLRRLVPFRQTCVTLVPDDETHLFYSLTTTADGGVVVAAPRLLSAQDLPSNPERQPDRFYQVKDLAQVTDLSPVEQQMADAGIRSYISVPLITEREFIGAVGLGASVDNAFAAEHVEVVREVADMLAIATRQSQLYRKLEQTNDDLGKALTAKREMIQNVSHELRTPLTLICGYAKLLREEALGPLTPEQDKALAIMDSESDQLHFMVNRLLTLQTLDAKALQKSSVYPSFLLQQAVEAWQSRASETRIRLTLEADDELPNICVDYELLNQVIYNLLDNAIKFSPLGGNIVLRTWATPTETLISVSDQGVGIAPQKLEKIFERFYQVDGSSTRAFGGMGIGLALCQKIVGAHEGRLWAESAGEGMGSTFYIALPMVEPLEQEEVG